jgi:hypothetical protein
VYWPYFRGKQFELIAVRETAELMADAGIVPIIEPVREGLTGLSRALDAVTAAGGEAVLIVNPRHGDHAEQGQSIEALFAADYSENESVRPGILLASNTPLAEAQRLFGQYNEKVVFIHTGFMEGTALAQWLGETDRVRAHVFLDAHHGIKYRKHYQATHRVILKDGFKRKVNREYPRLETFDSDLHTTYQDYGANGFGDFLIVGDEFLEGGGPAYAVAIHLTFIDRTRDDDMFIFHFVSERRHTATDPAGKFGEALADLVTEVTNPNTQVEKTAAVEEFLDLHARGHFPGLGYVKKLSMKHHIETLARYLE